MEKTKRHNYTWLGLLLFIGVTIGATSTVKVNNIIERIPVYLEHKDEPCNEQTVKAYLKSLNVKYPHIVYQQVIVETNRFRSIMFKDRNNLLGMEYTTGRPTLGKSIGQRFAKYNNWKESLADYAIWQAAMTREVRNEDEYYELLDKVYCPSSLAENSKALYSDLLKQVKDTL